ncbi:outer membrane protein assembly factor BamE domain-containing protein [Persephonella sp.]
MRKIILFMFLSFIFIFIEGCSTYSQTSQATQQKFTLGLVQKKIKIGMSQAEVVEALGSPNIITTDAEGNEAWVYDKIATSVEKSKKEGFVFLILLGGSAGSAKAEQSQRTMTVVIKFDKNKKVRDVKYHVTQF